MGVYKPCLVDGNTVDSGHGPHLEDGSLIMGTIGKDLIRTGQLAARQTGLTILATVRSHLGSLDKVRRVIKVLGR